MNTLVISDDVNVKVEYKTDIMRGTPLSGNFTVLDVIGLNDAETALGINFRKLTYDIATFKAFCQAHNLKLTRIDGDVSTVVADYTSYGYSY